MRQFLSRKEHKMKTAKYILFFALFVMLGQSSFVYAVAAQKASLPEAAAPSAKLESYVNNLVFTGKVKQIPGATVLVTTSNTYLLSGGDFSGIVDRKVNVIGKVVSEGSIEKLIVSQIQLASQ